MFCSRHLTDSSSEHYSREYFSEYFFIACTSLIHISLQGFVVLTNIEFCSQFFSCTFLLSWKYQNLLTLLPWSRSSPRGPKFRSTFKNLRIRTHIFHSSLSIKFCRLDLLWFAESQKPDEIQYRITDWILGCFLTQTEHIIDGRPIILKKKIAIEYCLQDWTLQGPNNGQL